MARDIEFDVNTDYRGRGLLDAADDMDRYARRVENADHKMRGLAAESGHVETSIRKLRQSVVDIGAEIDRTGDKSLFSKLNKDRSQLRAFERIAKDAEQAGEAAGDAMSKGILSSLGDLGGNLRGAVIPVAIGLGVALAPTLGAVIAGVVVGAVGAGGIAGGIAAAAQDPKVKAAASVFGSEISREFAATGHLFVEPTIEALQILEASFRDLHLEAAFAKVAPFVDDLARGIGGFATQAMPGLNRALDAAGPALAFLGEELPQVGKAFGDMVGDIAQSKGAMDGLRFILLATENTLGGVGKLVEGLGATFHFFASAAAEVSGAMEDLAVAVPGASSLFALMNNNMEDILGTAPKMDAAWDGIPGRMDASAEAAARAAGATDKNIAASAALKLSMDAAAFAAKAESDALDTLKRSLDETFNTAMALDQANLAIKSDTLELKKAVDEHGASLSNNTQEGLNNQQMLLGLVGDYERQRDAASTSKEATAKATDKFNDQVGALIKLAGKLGFSKDQIEALLGKYRELIKQPNITKTITYRFVTSGHPPSVAPQIGGAFVASAFADGGWVPGAPGQAVPAIVHGGEFVLSRDMLSGKVAAPAGPSGGGGFGGAGGAPVVALLRVVHELPGGEVIREELLEFKATSGLTELGLR